MVQVAHCIFMKESFGEARFGYTTLYRPCVPRPFLSIQIWHIFITCKKSHGGPRDPAGKCSFITRSALLLRPRHARGPGPLVPTPTSARAPLSPQICPQPTNSADVTIACVIKYPSWWDIYILALKSIYTFLTISILSRFTMYALSPLDAGKKINTESCHPWRQ